MKDTVKPLPEEMVLLLEFDNGINEIPPEASFSNPFAKDQMTLRHYLQAIDAAKTDDRVKGIYARLRGGGFQLAQIQEIRNAIKDFKESGKFAYIYSTSFGEGGGGLGRYYLSSVFDELWMQPLGIVMIAGVNAEMPFARGVLEKIGVEPQFFQRKEYKTAYENLTDKSMSAANRETMERLVGDISFDLVRDISADRDMTPEKFKALVDKGLLTADEALAEGLIDQMSYADLLIERIKKDVTGDPENEDLVFQQMKDYVEGVQAEQDKKNTALVTKGEGKPGVAVVYVVGAIMTGKAGVSAAPLAMMDGGIAASDVIAPAILEAMEDETIHTIVLRVDSPGGSPAASEAILRALDKAKEKGKNIVVSMGGTAASGGYWVAAHADHIFVSPMTVTGSIGVLGGKFSMRELWEKLDINWEGVSWGENAGMWSANAPFDAAGAERMNAMLDNVYRNFLIRVAKGRGMSIEDVDKVAGGRVWTGKRALEVGLADKEGGLNDALDYAATLSGGQNRHDITVQLFPKPKTALEELIAILSGEEVSAPSMPKVMEQMALEAFRPLLRSAVVARDPQGFTTYEPVTLE